MKKTIINLFQVKEVRVNTSEDNMVLQVTYYDNLYNFYYEASGWSIEQKKLIEEAYKKIADALFDGKQYVEVEL